MIEAILAQLMGGAGGILALVIGGVAALFLGRWQGARGERERRAGQDAQDYRNERKRQDEIDVGHGATDDERIRMLRRIEGGNGGRND